MTRRALLSGAAVNGLLLVGPSRAGDARGPDLAAFLRLSERLTGRSRLPADVAELYFQSIVGPAGSRRRRRTTGGEQGALDARIVADWYSGQTVASSRMVCVDYAGALVWDAIGFAKPRGVPDAEAGRWALAPD